MSLKLIREAQLMTTLGKEDLAVLQELKKVLGKDSISSLVEAFHPNQDDYAKWLDVIVGYAGDEGISLKRKADFVDVAFAVLDNDPAGPSDQMKQSLANKLWLDYKASKHHNNAEQIAQSHEEDEELVDSLHRMLGGSDESETDTDAGSDLDGETDDNAHVCPQCGTPLDDDGEPEEPQCDCDSSCSDDEGDEGDALEHDRVGGVEKIGRLRGQPRNDEGLPGGFPYGEENEERSPMSAKTGDVVTPKQPTSFLHQAITSPREDISQALKDVESDGESAWKAHQLPKNPHPKKSMAFKAWERGMKKAAKAHLGFEDRASSTSKPKKK